MRCQQKLKLAIRQYVPILDTPFVTSQVPGREGLVLGGPELGFRACRADPVTAGAAATWGMTGVPRGSVAGWRYWLGTSTLPPEYRSLKWERRLCEGHAGGLHAE
jgi:hypothetical protein